MDDCQMRMVSKRRHIQSLYTVFHLYDILEKAKLKGHKQISSYQDWSRGKGLTAKGNIWGDGNALYFDCSGIYTTICICLNS